MLFPFRIIWSTRGSGKQVRKRPYMSDIQVDFILNLLIPINIHKRCNVFFIHINDYDNEILESENTFNKTFYRFIPPNSTKRIEKNMIPATMR